MRIKQRRWVDRAYSVWFSYRQHSVRFWPISDNTPPEDTPTQSHPSRIRQAYLNIWLIICDQDRITQRNFSAYSNIIPSMTEKSYTLKWWSLNYSDEKGAPGPHAPCWYNNQSQLPLPHVLLRALIVRSSNFETREKEVKVWGGACQLYIRASIITTLYI